MIDLYEGLKEVVKQGDVDALSCMHLIEEQFKELLNPKENSSNKVIQNKFFRLQVPKSCTAVINDEGGTIRFSSMAPGWGGPCSGVCRCGDAGKCQL